MAVKFNFNGTEHFGYKVSDIEKLYAETVANYIEGGYRISLEACSSGSQSNEINHVDLTDGKNIIRVVLVTNRSLMDDCTSVIVWSLKILEFEDGYGCNMLWNDKGTELVSIDYYNIGKSNYDRPDLFFVRDLELYREIMAMRDRKRWNTKSSEQVLPKSSHVKAVKLIKKIRGFGRLSDKDIEKVVRQGNHYNVYFTFKNMKQHKVIFLAR
jgi:hypothetical protein